MQEQQTQLSIGGASVSFIDVHAVYYAIYALRRRKPWEHKRRKKRGVAPETYEYNFERVLNIDTKNDPGKAILTDVLEKFRGLNATNPRDMIYAPLNIAEDVPANAIVVDYNKSVAEVNKDVAVFYFAHLDFPLDYLSYCGSKSFELEILDGLASWMPQWKDRYPRSMFQKTFVSKEGESTRVFNACGTGYNENHDHSQRPRIDGFTLFARGFRIDEIATLSMRSIHLSHADGIDDVSKWAPPDPDAAYIAGGTHMDAFLHTLLTDIDGIDRDTPDWVGYRRGGKADWDFDRGCLAPSRDPDRQPTSTLYAQLRALATTSYGYMGLVSHQAQVGDSVFVLLGGSMLYLLRPHGDDGSFLFVGECYVHGLMDGQAMHKLKDGSAKMQSVRIV